MPSCFAPNRSIARRLAWLKKPVRNSTAIHVSVIAELIGGRGQVQVSRRRYGKHAADILIAVVHPSTIPSIRFSGKQSNGIAIRGRGREKTTSVPWNQNRHERK